MPENLNNRHGMTLVETIVAMGLVGVAALLIAQMAQNASRAQNSIKMDAAFQNAVSIASQILQNHKLCSTNMASANLPVKTLNTSALNTQVLNVDKLQSSMPSGPVVLSLNAPVMPGLKLTKMQLRNFQEVNAGVNYWAEVYFEAVKDGGSFLGSKTLSASFMIPVQTTGTVPNLTVSACGLKTPPQPISLVGCYNNIITNHNTDPCPGLTVDGFKYKDGGFGQNLGLPCLPPPMQVRTVVCVPD